MSKIIGVTVGTPTSPSAMEEKIKPVKSVNGNFPDASGNVEIDVTGGSGGVDLTGYATEQYVKDYAQPKGNYLTEHQDISGKLDASKLPEAIDNALAQAKASGEFDGMDGDDYVLTEDDKRHIAIMAAALVEVPEGGGGDPGEPGKDGITPHIGANGNWFIGETDTGVKAQGEDGDDYVLTDTDRAEIAEQAAQMVIDDAPVKSVNGKTGAVTLAATDVGARPSTWTPSATDVGADPKGTANTAVSTHNVATDAHNDLRLLIDGLTSRLNALANSTDEDLDQMAEMVAYIKENRELISGITANKVSVADIINNLTTNVSNKPLSAAQGVALKALIDAITVPTKLSQLTNDKGYITGYTETDPTVPSWAKAASKPSYTKSEVGLGNVDNVKQYSASNPPPYPVKSVNGMTGAVQLTADDFGAATKEEFNQLSADIDNLQSGAVIVPDYWQSHIDSKIAAIKALQDEGGKDAFSFIVIADPHYPQNLGKNSGKLAKKIMDECDIRYVMVLGDMQSRGQHSTKAAALADFDGIREMFKPVAENVLYQRGNHDGSWGSTLNGVTYPYNFKPEELYNRIHALTYKHHNAVTDESGTGYYVDDTARKVRYILLNTHCNDYELNADGSAKYSNMKNARFTQSQYDMLIAALNTVPSDNWSVIVAAHVPIVEAYAEAWGGTSGDFIIMRNLLKAYKTKGKYNVEWSGTADGSGGGYTNLFDVAGSGYVAWDGSKMYTNWMPYNRNDNDRKGTLYHFKGVTANNSPYKVHWATDAAGAGATALSYCNTSNTPPTTSDYDSSVKIYQHYSGSDNHKYIQFEFREDIAENLIITANEPIVESSGGDSGYDAVSIDVDFSSAKGEIVGYFAGHMHNDYIYEAASGYGVNIITTRCDGANENDSTLLAERVAGTVTEQSFDVFTVNRKTGTVNATKIGAGADRTINY